MSQKNVQDYLEKGMYGTPQIKPDEQRKYLGTFRERVYLSMTHAEMASHRNLGFFKTELTTNPHKQVLISAAVPFNLQNTYMQAAQKANCSFKIVETDNKKEADAIGLVYIAEEAVNIEPISVTEKYHSQTKVKQKDLKPVPNTPPEKKKKWFTRLFK